LKYLPFYSCTVSDFLKLWVFGRTYYYMQWGKSRRNAKAWDLACGDRMRSEELVETEVNRVPADDLAISLAW
jgi:hypothetical protein